MTAVLTFACDVCGAEEPADYDVCSAEEPVDYATIMILSCPKNWYLVFGPDGYKHVCSAGCLISLGDNALRRKFEKEEP